MPCMRFLHFFVLHRSDMVRRRFGRCLAHVRWSIDGMYWSLHLETGRRDKYIWFFRRWRLLWTGIQCKYRPHLFGCGCRVGMCCFRCLVFRRRDIVHSWFGCCLALVRRGILRMRWWRCLRICQSDRYIRFFVSWQLHRLDMRYKHRSRPFRCRSRVGNQCLRSLVLRRRDMGHNWIGHCLALVRSRIVGMSRRSRLRICQWDSCILVCCRLRFR